MPTEALRLLAAARAGDAEGVKRALAGADHDVLAAARDSTGATPLHLAALGAHEDALEALLESAATEQWALARAAAGTPLHCAVQSAVPMVAYQLASKQPVACLEQDAEQQTPIQLAAAADKGEVLNAMLLACAGHATPAALDATRQLLAAGAVPDTWAPNGSSALMLAASVDCAEGVALLLDNAASLELQDALGRTALMFAAGNNAQAALESLLDRGASVSIRDRRGRNVLGYAAEGSEVRRVLEARIAEMESRAARLQEELLAELLEDEAAGAQAKEQQRPGKKGKKKKGKAGGKFKAVAEPAAAEVGEAAAAAEEAEAQPEQPSSQPAAEQAAEAAPEGPPPAAQPAADGEGALEGDDERPSSPDWQVVGKPSRQQRSGVNASQQHHHHHQHPGQLDGGSLHLRRCPSASSLGSSCSGDSHETVGGSSVGSQRSVLVHPSRSSSAAGRAAASKPAGSKPVVIMAASPPTKPAWGKLAAAVALAVPAAPPAPQPAQDQVEPQQPAAAQQPVQAAAAGGVPAGLPLAEAQDAAALAAEVAALRAQLVQGQLERQQAEDRHQLELAAVVEEAARHEAAAVAQAAAAERTRCIFRFAAFLQSSPVAPELLASYGLTGAAASFPAATISGPAVAAPAFPADTPLAGLARLGKSAPVPVPAAPAPLLGGDLCAAGSLSPLSASPPFCYSGLEQRLREEFAGDMSCFLQPAAAELG